jgi:hypothetical protein
MTPKEKAQELIDSMYNTPHCDIEHFPSKHYCDCSEINFFQAKHCAVIAVDECIELLLNINPHMAFPQQVEYWQEVKHELDKL